MIALGYKFNIQYYDVIYYRMELYFRFVRELEEAAWDSSFRFDREQYNYRSRSFAGLACLLQILA